MHQYRRHAASSRSTRKRLWYPRACERRMVALRMDYVTSQGWTGLGLVRNLSVQGLFFDSASCQVTPEMAPGELLTVVVVLPSGQPCKLRAVVVHCHRQGCGLQFREGLPQALEHLANYWSSLEEAG